MALRVEVGVAELAATRFAVSPLSETVACLQQLSGRDRHTLNLRWSRWAEAELASTPLDLSRTWPLLVSTRPSWPEFLVPAPPGTVASIDEDLDTLQATTAQQVRSSLARVFGDDLPPAAAALAARPAEGLRILAAELHTAYDRLVAPYWPRIRAVLEADVVYRSHRLTAGGARMLFSDLHRDLHWQDGQLRLTGERRHTDKVVDRGPGGLVLMPVVLGSPAVLIKKHTSTQTTVRYPARGVGTLWAAETPRPPRKAERLLGRARTQILEALRSPGTTTELAGALNVTPSAVSQHLAVLHESGLVARERFGRHVLYVTTELGTRLL